MNKTSVLHAPSWAHQGEFIAYNTINQFQACVEASADATSSEGMTYLQTVRKLQAMSGNHNDQTALIYLGYKWPTEDDYYLRNSLSSEYITAGEGIIGLKVLPGVRIQEYVGTDYTNSSGVKIGLAAPIHWGTRSHGAELAFTTSGQLADATASAVVRAQLIEKKGDWVTIEFVNPYITSIVGS